MSSEAFEITERPLDDVLSYIRAHGPCTIEGVHTALGRLYLERGNVFVSDASLRVYLSRLRQQGLIRRKGRVRSDVSRYPCSTFEAVAPEENA